MSEDYTNREELERRLHELEAQVQNLEKDLIHDKLTGLKTRAFFEEEVGTYLTNITHSAESKRKEWFGFRNIGIIFLDIDYFKKVNDTYGHDVGDIVLQRVSMTISADLRSGDTPARWGGEEIVVSLLGADERDSMIKAEYIRAEVEKLTFPEAPELRLTISAGVTSSKQGKTVSELVKQADKALYEAKESGRNKVVVYGDKGNR